MKIIDSFRGEYGFLSNFSPHPVFYNGVTYPTAEHAFQAAKAATKEEHDLVVAAPTPAEAKRRGQKVELKPGWDMLKYSTMLEIVAFKFYQNKDILERLLKTGDAELIEGNWWGDTVWGMVKDAQGNWVGDNTLGKVLMQVRAVLQKWREQGSI